VVIARTMRGLYTGRLRFAPSGMVAPSNDPHAANCSRVMMAPRRLAFLRLEPLVSAPVRSALLRSVPDSTASRRDAPASLAPLRLVDVSLRNGLASSL